MVRTSSLALTLLSGASAAASSGHKSRRSLRTCFGRHLNATDSKGDIYTDEVFAGQRVQRFGPADSPRGKLLERLARVP